MSEKVYLNGELLDAKTARVGITNPAFQHGVGLFETLRTYDSRPFGLDRHIERMRESARKLNMPVEDVFDKIPAAVQAVTEANHLQNARLRFTVTPPGAQDEAPDPTLLVMAQETAGYPPELYEKGMTVYIADQYRQSAHDPLAGHKTTCYYPRLIALRQAQTRQCGEAIWATPANYLAEGSLSNLFIVKGGRLKTPPLDTPVLPGVTRAIILDLARQQAIPPDEAPCTINDLLDADEVFLTNAIMEIMPVTRVEKRPIASEKPGAITRKLADAYRALATQPTTNG